LLWKGGSNAAPQPNDGAQPAAPLPQNPVAQQNDAAQPAAPLPSISAAVWKAINAIRHAAGEIHINLSKKVKTKDEIEAIASALREVRYPIWINLNHNEVNDEEVIILATALVGNRFPIYISLDENYITDDGASILANLFLNSQAEVRISLGRNLIGDFGAIQIARGMQGSKYPAEIDLCDNRASDSWDSIFKGELSDAVAFEFAEVIKSAKQKRVIGLSSNGAIHYVGVIALLRAIKDADASITLDVSMPLSGHFSEEELFDMLCEPDYKQNVFLVLCEAIKLAKHPLTLKSGLEYIFKSSVGLKGYEYSVDLMGLFFKDAVLEAKSPIKFGFGDGIDETMSALLKIIAEGVSKRPFMPSIISSAEYMAPYYQKELDRLANIILALPRTTPSRVVAEIISHECVFKDTPEENRRLFIFTDKVIARMYKIIEEKKGKAGSKAGLAITPTLKEKSDGSLPPSKSTARGGAGSPKVFPIRDRWYDDDDINRLMDTLFGNLPGLTLTHALNINAEGGDVFRDNLRAREENIRAGAERINRILIPVNLGAYNPAAGIAGTHWAGLRIDRAQTAEGRVRIRYFDPLGNDIPDRLRNILIEVYPNAEIIVNRHRFQVDGCNCGPWVIEIFEHLERDGEFPAVPRDITTVRNGYRRILAAPGYLGRRASSASPGSVVTTIAGSGDRVGVFIGARQFMVSRFISYFKLFCCGSRWFRK
jgi:hypothetical protein